MQKFVGVVLGGDMNSYAVARAFYEAYHQKTIILGKSPLYPTTHSKLIEAYYYETLLEDKTLLEAMKFLENKYPDTKKILFGNTDYYVRHLMKNRKEIEKISSNFIFPMTSLKQFDQLFNKETFYQLCEKYHLTYPKSIVFDFKKDTIKDVKIPFSYPVFLKPSDTVIYSEYEFVGKQKGYKVENKDELNEVLKTVKNSGFQDKFMIQEYISGNDDTMFVYTAYVNQNHQVVGINGGKILMHDRTPELIGNYNAITNACDKKLAEELRKFLEKIKFTGICHFDIQYDLKRKKYYVFEINIRQGRSNYYNLAAGFNLVQLIVEDYIEHKTRDFFVVDKKFTASIVPKWALKKALKKHHQKEHLKNFSRFTLAPYDMNIKRYYCQWRWDSNIIKAYFKYN